MSGRIVQLIPLLLIVCFFQETRSAFALDQIVRPYQSVRSAAMGGVRMTTGLYDENFFNNPARVTANPESKFTLLQLTPVEVNPAALSEGSQIVGGKDALGVITDNAGKNIHDRFQLVFPAYYLASTETRRWAMAFAIITSIQMDADVRQSYQMTMGGIADVGPALTIGRKFLKDDALSVGFTGHFTYRMGTSPNYSLLDYVRGVPLSFSSLANDGAMINLDIGATYKLTKWGEFDISVAGAIQNLLGGNYSHTLLSLLKQGGGPPPQLRSYGFGASATRADWWKFTNTVFALEDTDVLNNTNGSIFRLLHMGGETHWKSIALRLGLNQGYLGGGIGFDFFYFNLDLTTYGEEMSLNTGGLEDRRYTFDIGLHL